MSERRACAECANRGASIGHSVSCPVPSVDDTLRAMAVSSAFRSEKDLIGEREETRLGMLVGVAVGFELARELGRAPRAPGSQTTQED